MSRKRPSGTVPSSATQDWRRTSTASSDSDGAESHLSEGPTFMLRINEPHPGHPATPQVPTLDLPLTSTGESAESTTVGTGASDPQSRQTAKKSRKRKKRPAAGKSPVITSTSNPEADHERHWRMAGAVYEKEVTALMAGEREQLSVIARAYLQHLQEASSFLHNIV